MSKFFFLLTILCGSAVAARAETKTAIFAGGCFWCMQEPFDHVKGVTKTVVGYTGGSKEDANYTAVSAHKTKHREAIEVIYDPARISYDRLLDVFWRNINPTQADGQFADIGLSYQAAIYYQTEEEKRLAEASKGNSGNPESSIGRSRPRFCRRRLSIRPKNITKNITEEPGRYQAYHVGSGRVSYLEKIWGKP